MSNVTEITINFTSDGASDADLTAAKTTAQIWIYGGASLLILGSIGNTLTVIVIMRSKLRRLTTSVYLIVLAIVDTAVLYNGLMRYWLNELTGVDIRMMSIASCKIQTFLAYFLVHFEAWILVCVAFERVAAIFFPHRAKVIFTQRFAIVQIAFTGLILITINLHFFWTHTLLNGRCLLSDDKFEYFADNIWKWLDFVLSSFAPFVFMLSFNVAIISRLIYLKRRKNRSTDINNRKLNTMTGILVTISFVFFLTTAPISFLWRREYHDLCELEKEEWAIVNIIAYTNNAINFILYCLSGPGFRKELIKLLNIDKFLNKIHPTEQSTIHNEGS